MKYTLNDLVNIFEKQAEESEENRLELLETWKENYPDLEIPIHFKDKFNIATALAQICEHILTLEKKIL